MFTVTFGYSQHVATADSLVAAVAIADALSVQKWLHIMVTDPDGNRVDWRTAS